MISFFVNLSIAMPLSDANVLIKLEIASTQADRVSSSAKLCVEPISTRKNKSLIKSLKKTDLSTEPSFTPEMISL